MTTTTTAMVRLAGALGAMGVGAGAYGSHLLESSWQERRLDMDDADVRRWLRSWNAAWIMNMTGSVATLALAATSVDSANSAAAVVKRRLPAAVLIGGGTLVFSLSTYVAAYHADRKYAVGGPLGGSATILGWLLLLMAP